MVRNCKKKSWEWKLILSAGLVAGCATALAADTITGTARNQTRGVPAAGDQVILLRLDQGMQEEARATTDASGAFAIKIQFPDKPHLVRIMHEGVNYDQQASAGDVLSIDVFDSAKKVSGITGSIEILRTGTNGNLLHVSDMIEIKNESSPPLTQAGERTFDVYLPAKAKIDSVLAAGSGKFAVLISASPAAGEPGHYTVGFPLRPGSTKFAFNYDVPYDGHAAFRPKLAHPLRQFDVMIPPTMKFSSRSPSFQVLATGNKDYQVQAANQLKAGEGPAFEITGAGAMPALQPRARPQTTGPAAPLPGSPVQSSAVRSPAAQGRTGFSGTNPRPQTPAKNDTQAAAAPVTFGPSTVDWWLFAAIAVLAIGACGYLIWRTRRRSRSTSAVGTTPALTNGRPSAASSTSLLEALKEELLELETSRIKGSISRGEYDAAKQALEGTVKRALTRAAAKQ